ncbi:MAG: 2-amino-4-hydroxy-6-hydroxymethyldihydropteridine diphosphokinase [Chloroflexi bacterium RBG_16_52_11]|nr:MAG: 2-amino-4-hydroxy-6-hydroxymethyldihydropteridine diphosphokinase [Chloroflexi bacterium RBG_16_52_11]
MSEIHKAYLCLGSNIRPEIYLPKAIELLRQHGRVQTISSAWETRAIGSNGPNYLNACLLLLTPLSANELKEEVIRPIEEILGRVRNQDKYASRSIDIDIVMFDETPHKPEYWDKAFMLIPLTQLNPDLFNPLTQEKLSITAERIKNQTWIVEHKGILRAA